MPKRKVEKRLSSFRTRWKARKKKTKPKNQSQLEKIVLNRASLKRILLVGNSSERNLSASYLESRLGVPLFRVDLALITSKYIGETEKNLEQIFTKAEQNDCILFFDEADALFGKRTEISDAHDRFANSSTNYLLHRLENFEGLVILASNPKNRISDDIIKHLKLYEIGKDDDEEDDNEDNN